MNRKLLHVITVPFIVLLFGLAVAAGLGVAPVEQARALGTVYYVDDDTCPAPGSGTQPDPYCRIQTGVDAASDGDEIRVAAGAYTGTQLVIDSRTGYTYTQVVFITRSVTLRGGYDAGDWNADPDPVANPTVIDAERSGRAVSIVGTHSDPPAVAVDGFTLTGGDYTGLGNPPGGGYQVCHEGEGTDCGGGLFTYWTHLTLRNCTISDNIASRNDDSHGGGIYLWMVPSQGPGVLIENTVVISNSALGSGGQGGGMFVDGLWQPITITHSTFQDNHADDRGGGMRLYNTKDPVIVKDTDFLSNTSQYNGGGAFVPMSINGDALRMEGGRFQNNGADGLGSAIYLEVSGLYSPRAWLSNLLFSGNRNASGSVIYASSGNRTLEVDMAHVTAADNQVLTFLQASSWGANHWVTATLTNTLLVSFTNGFAAYEGNSGEVVIRHTNTLTQNVATLHYTWDGSPTFTAINPLGGDPKLDSTYHLQAGSAAIDAGVDAGVTTDMDGDFRPQGTAPDIGADEYYDGSVSPAELTVSGPDTTPGQVSTDFSAAVSPVTATAPFTYVWQATGQSPVTHTERGANDTVSFTWDTPGDKIITATVTNILDTIVDTHTVHVSGTPVLAIGKTGPAEALVGAPITYTLTVTNSGIEAANNLLITDTLPAGSNYVSGGTLVSDEVQWSVGNLAANGGTTQVSFVVTATQNLVNDDYRVSADGGYSAVGTASVETVVGVPDLSISKEGPHGAVPGEQVTYDLTIVNDGPVAATNLLITDTLPAGATYVSGGTLVGGEVRWNVASLAGNGGQTQVSFVVTADETITNDDYRVSADGGFGAAGTAPVVTIIGPAGMRFVAPGGTDGTNPCTDNHTPCATLQHAVNVAAEGDEIRVAAGTYSGAQTVIDSRTGYTYTQVVYVDKSLTLRGGYDAGDWNADPDPAANSTVIDAERAGRGISIVGVYNDEPAVTVDGFTITGGDYTGLGNPPGGGYQVCHEGEDVDCGGGLYATWSHLTLRNCVISDNIASRNDDSHGGGIYIYMVSSQGPGILIENTTVISNTAPANGGQGGGMFVDGLYQPITITHSIFQDNYADHRGGGMRLYNISDLVIVRDTDFLSNTSQYNGGGAYIPMSINGEALRMEGGHLQNNRANGSGSAIYLEVSGTYNPRARLTNLLFSGNRNAAGSVIYASSGQRRLEVDMAHVTAADNQAATFLYASAWGANHWVTATLTNTLLVSFTNGFAAYEGNSGEVVIRHTNTLTQNVATLHYTWGGLPTFTATNTLTGDPKLDATYHLLPGSAAIDAGVDAGVTHDIDGDARPQNKAPDIGADECFIRQVYLPLVMRD